MFAAFLLVLSVSSESPRKCFEGVLLLGFRVSSSISRDRDGAPLHVLAGEMSGGFSRHGVGGAMIGGIGG